MPCRPQRPSAARHRVAREFDGAGPLRRRLLASGLERNRFRWNVWRSEVFDFDYDPGPNGGNAS
jgi:hypothetical protein